METLQRQIGQLIKNIREAKNISQKDFAKMLETSPSAVVRMEKGEQNFSTGMITKISQILGKELVTISEGAIDFKIEGGKKLSGTISVNGSKNSAVALLFASLINKQTTILENVPRIEEVARIIEVLESIGVKVKWLDESKLSIQPNKKVDIDRINTASAIKTRSIIMAIGALIGQLEYFTLPQAGGCKLGSRTVRPHLYALEKLGIKIKTEPDRYVISRQKLTPQEIVLYESGDTVTENVLLAASQIAGKTVIKLASANYMVQDLCFFLQKLGVRIDGVGTTTLIVYGKSNIARNINYQISEDPIEAMLFLSIAATTNSHLIIKRCPIDFLELELLKLEKMGFKYQIIKRYKSYNGRTHLVDIEAFPSKLVALEEKIYARPFPGLNIDNLPFFVPIATQAKGQTLIHDWVYENRAIYYMELTKLGANMILADPHRVFIEGPTKLKGAQIVCPPALRPAVIILIAMLAAKGTSILRNVYSINRGYEDLCNRLKKIRAQISIYKSY